MTDPNNPYPTAHITSVADHIRNNEVLWEQRRYEASVAAMQGIISNRMYNATDTAKEAVKYADALIEELRKP